MQSWFRRVAIVAAVGVLCALGAGNLHAQGVTTAAVTGTVKQESGAPVEGAIVSLTNRSTGSKRQATTQSSGRYTMENVPVGGPYTIEVRGIGFESLKRDDVMLSLGQRFVSDFTLRAQVVQLQEIAVNAETGDPVMNTAKTGVAQSIGDNTISRLPVLGGNFTNLVATTPQVAAVSGGVSAGGQNNRFNSIQIDGGVNNDLFGLGSTGAPGGQADARAISFAAVKELQVLIAPYDVRQGNFAGGLVNAVTQSGTNTFHGSVFGRLQNQDLVGLDVNGINTADFKVLQYGGTLSGAIIKDKLQFFGAADIQERTTPFDGITLEESGAAPGDAQRMINHLNALGAGQWGGAGSAGGFTIENPNPTYFGKLTWSPAPNHNVSLSYNNVGASVDVISRRRNGDWSLTSNSYSIDNQTNSLRLIWSGVFGGKYSNEFIGGVQTIRDQRPPAATYPTIYVGSGGSGTRLAAGAERFSQDNSLDQDIYEVTDNLTVGIGDHRVTIGTHNEFFGFNNHFFPQSIGQWTFANVDSFENNAPVRFDRALPLIPGGPVSDFSVNQWGLYAQDQFNLGNLALTVGLRWDDPVFPDSPTYNPTLDSITSDGALWTGGAINTSVVPSGNATWSPRLGFNWDVDGGGMTIVRGGVGYFGGRPAYVWMSNAYVNTGMAQTQLTCRNDNSNPDDNVPGFTLDPSLQPSACAGTAGVIPPIPTINYFDPDFKFEQNMKLSLGVDRRLPWGMVGTIDLLYSKTQNSLYIQDNNLQGVVDESTLTYATGEGNRARYGVNSLTTGSATPRKQTVAFGNVLEHLQPVRGPRLQRHHPAAEALLQRRRVQRRLHLQRRPGPDVADFEHRLFQLRLRDAQWPAQRPRADHLQLQPPGPGGPEREHEHSWRFRIFADLLGRLGLALRLRGQRRRQRRRRGRHQPRVQRHVLRPARPERHHDVWGDPERVVRFARVFHRRPGLPPEPARPDHGAKQLPQSVDQPARRPAPEEHPDLPRADDDADARRVQPAQHDRQGLGPREADQRLRGAEHGAAPRLGPALQPRHLQQRLPDRQPGRSDRLGMADSAGRQVHLVAVAAHGR